MRHSPALRTQKPNQTPEPRLPHLRCLDLAKLVPQMVKLVFDHLSGPGLGRGISRFAAAFPPLETGAGAGRHEHNLNDVQKTHCDRGKTWLAMQLESEVACAPASGQCLIRPQHCQSLSHHAQIPVKQYITIDHCHFCDHHGIFCSVPAAPFRDSRFPAS